MVSESPDRITPMPSKMATRRSTRAASITASAKIQVEIEDQSPETVKAPPKTPKTPRTPKTPKSKTVQHESQTPRSTGRRSAAVPKTPTNAL